MDINQINEFLTLMELGSFSKAAVELNMSQPALTKHMQALERDAGGTLIKRRGKGLALTELGEVFMPYAERLSKEYEKLEGALYSYRRGRDSSFSLGIVRNLRYYDVAGLLAGFRKKYPDCVINVVENDDFKLKRMYAEGRLNLITAALAADNPNLPGTSGEFLEIGHGRIIAVLPDTIKTAKKKISIEEVCQYPLVIPERTSVFAKMIRGCIREAGLDANVLFEGSSSGCMDFTMAGMGIALQSQEVAKGRSYPGMREAVLEPELAYRYGLLYREKSRLSTWERRFVQFILEEVGGSAG